MQSQISPIDPVTVELHVEVPWDRFHKGVETEYGKLQKNARIKGFRQGKAPRNVIVQLFSKSVRDEVTSSLVNESVVEAVQKHELPVVSTPVLKDAPKVVDGTGMTFTVKVEVRPKVETLDTALELVRRVKPVTDADVDAEIERMRQTHAVVEPLEAPRPAQKGDVLTVDYTVSVDGVAKPDMAGSDRSIELGNGQLLPEIEAGLTGAELGQTRSISVARGADEANKELAGKTVVFEMTVKEMKERKLPALDDELAKDIGDYASFAELTQKTRERLEESAKAQGERALRDLAIEKLVEKNAIPVPPSLLDQQLRAMLQEFMQLMQMMGQKPQLNPMMVEEMKPRAEAKVRAALLLGELSRKASIAITAEEVEAKLKEMAEKSGKHIAKLRVEYTGEKREQLETQLLEDKLIKHLLSVSSISDGPWEEPNKAKAEEAKESA
ncbi:MAG: trigger factor [Sandaracinaceae bacterium]|nr:trigger factor [Sandaracinaceae bacterium]